MIEVQPSGERPAALPRAMPVGARLTWSRPWWRAALAAGGLVGLVAAAIWAIAMKRGVSADFQAHASMTAGAITSGVYPGNPLLYLADALLAGYSPNLDRLVPALAAILVVSIVGKVALSVLYVASATHWCDRRRTLIIGAIAAGLCSLTFAIAPRRLYPGVLPPNVWHNSTVVMLMPLAVGMFWLSLAYLRTGTANLLGPMLLLAVLNVAVKPSFMFCFVVAFPIAALIRFGRGRATVLAWVVTAATVAMILIQCAYIYGAQNNGAASLGGQVGRNGVAVDPFRVWSLYCHNIPLAVLAMYVFPLVAFLVGGVSIRRDPGVRYACALVGVGLLYAALLKETGPRESHGNFLWQAIVANYLLFLAVAAAWVRSVSDRGWDRRHQAVALAFGAHVIAGVVSVGVWITS